MMLRDAGAGGAPRAAAVLHGRCRTPGRVWHRPQTKPMPDEPGWEVTVAAVSIGREQRVTQRWHDGIETTCNVARRALWRMAHGRKLPDGSTTGRFACARGELTHAFGRAGLFPKAGEPPRYDPRSEEWQEYLARTATQAKRITDYLEEAGIAVVRRERDNRGRDWRVVVELLAVEVDPRRLKEARDRHRAGAWERRRDRSEARGVKRDLRVISRAAKPLTAAERRRLHKEFHQRSRALSRSKGDLCDQREASRPTVAKPSVESLQTFSSPYTSGERRGAHGRGVPSLRSRLDALRQRPDHPNLSDPSARLPDHVTEEGGRGADASAGADAVLDLPRDGRSCDLERFTGFSAPAAQLAAATAQIASMAPTARQLDAETVAAVTAAWWQLRRGLTAAALPVTQDTAAAIAELPSWWPLAEQLEQLADHRPAGWSTSGAAMLLTLAVVNDLPPGSLQLLELAGELLELMRVDQASGGQPVAPLGSHLPPRVPAGYEGIATMRRRLTDQLAAAGDTIEAYPTLAAAERAAIAHELAGRIPLTLPDDWDAPWNRGKPQPTLWQPPSIQRAWRHRLLPPLPHDYAVPPRDKLAEPDTYATAIARTQAVSAGARITPQIAEDLVQAFHATRFGIAGAIAERKRPRASLATHQELADEWRRLVDHRPDGWPAAYPAAVLTAAVWRDPGSYENDGTPVRLQRPENLPMALGLLRELLRNMNALERRARDVAEGKRRRRGRGGRSPEHDARKAAKQAAQAPAPKFNFRVTGETPFAIAETPDQTYQRIRRQLLSTGRHPADYPSLEDAELELIDLEAAGHPLPGPSPSKAREARYAHARSTGPAPITKADWHHLAAATAQLLDLADRYRLAELTALSIHDGQLILTAPDDTLTWAKQSGLTRRLEHVARTLNLAHTAVLIDEHHAAVFAPTAELRGPADHRAARADRYADERTRRWAVRATADVR